MLSMSCSAIFISDRLTDLSDGASNSEASISSSGKCISSRISGYQSGASQFFPQAQIVFDRFHLMQMAGQAADQVRKELARAGADLKGALWALRGNEWTRSHEQRQQRSALCNRYPKLGRAIGLRDMLQDILADEDQEALRWWCKRAKLSRLEPFRELAQSIQKHWSGVVAFLKTRLTNGAIEAVNGLLHLLSV